MEKIQKNNKNIMDFARENMGIAAGTIIALASKDLIYSFVNDFLIPVRNKHLFTLTTNKFDIKNLFVNLITWFLVLINTYFLYKFINPN
jgi:large-conductance mechanosensitive channel